MKNANRRTNVTTFHPGHIECMKQKEGLFVFANMTRDKDRNADLLFFLGQQN